MHPLYSRMSVKQLGPYVILSANISGRGGGWKCNCHSPGQGADFFGTALMCYGAFSAFVFISGMFYLCNMSENCIATSEWPCAVLLYRGRC